MATDDAATVTEGGAVITVDVLTNDSDVDNTLSAATITSFGTVGTYGTFVDRRRRRLDLHRQRRPTTSSSPATSLHRHLR